MSSFTAAAAERRVSNLSAHLTACPTSSQSSSEEIAANKGKVCLIIGAGAGIGMNVARRYAEGGYSLALCRRTGQADLDEAVKALNERGCPAKGYLVDATTPNGIEDVVKSVEQELGPIHVSLYNLGAQIGNRPLDTIELKTFELGWKMGTFGLFRLAKVLMPLMTQRGTGTFIVSSATASVRGNAGQHSHAAAMGGRRLLCQTLNAEFAPKGVHVCHVLIDGPVNSPDTIGRMLKSGKPGFGQYGSESQDMSGEQFLQPVHAAETYYHLSQQHRSAWTFEVDLRPNPCTPWWNHA